MSKAIKLTIQEIVADYEMMIRHHERLDTQFDFERAEDRDIERFHEEMVELIEKYLPTYEKHIPKRYFLENADTFEKALMLYGELYENFKQIFYQLCD